MFREFYAIGLIALTSFGSGIVWATVDDFNAIISASVANQQNLGRKLKNIVSDDSTLSSNLQEELRVTEAINPEVHSVRESIVTPTGSVGGAYAGTISIYEPSFGGGVLRVPIGLRNPNSDSTSGTALRVPQESLQWAHHVRSLKLLDDEVGQALNY